MKKFAVFIVCMSVLLCGCADKDTAAGRGSLKAEEDVSEHINEASDDEEKKTSVPGEQLTLQEETVEIKIPEAGREYTFVFISDLHIIAGDGQVKEEKLEEVKSRTNLFVNADGIPAKLQWELLPGVVGSYGPDAVLLGGDMVDFASDENLDSMEKGLELFDTDVMYVRADHDYASWYTGLEDSYILDRYKKMNPCEEVSVMEMDGFFIVGVDNSTSQISDEALAELKDVFAKRKPIVLLTHVPVNSLVDDSLKVQSEAAWGGRNLAWGEGCYYEPDGNTQEFLDMIYAEDTPVVDILCGHLHLTWDGPVTRQVHQHVFSAAFEGNIGIVKVVP